MLIAIATVAMIGLSVVPWESSRPYDATPLPSSTLLNATNGPPMAQTVLGIWIVTLMASSIVRARRFRRITGDAGVWLAWSFAQLCWIPAIIAIPVLLQADWSTMRLRIWRVDEIPFGYLNGITVAAALIATLALACLTPALDASTVARWWRWPMLAPRVGAITCGTLLAIAEQRRSDGIVAALFASLPSSWMTQIGLLTFSFSGIIIAAITVALIVRRIRQIVRGARSAAVRNAALLGTAVGGPLIVGALLFGPIQGVTAAVDHEFAYTSIIVDQHGTAVRYFYRNGGDFRLPLPEDGIATSVYMALDATEDHGIWRDRDNHLPLQPVRLAGVIRQFLATGDIAGASGIASQTCKQIIGNPLEHAGLRLMRLGVPVPGEAFAIFRATEKGAYEFACGWTLEQSLLWIDRLTPGDDREALLRLYLQEVEFGHNVVGIEAASRIYFGISANALRYSQAALLVGLLRGPSGLDPWNHPDRALDRRNLVLDLMVDQGFISQEDAALSKERPLGILPEPRIQPDDQAASWSYVEQVVTDLHHQGGTGFSTSGRTVVTALDPAIQEDLNTALRVYVATNMAPGPGDTPGDIPGPHEAAGIVVNRDTGQIVAWFGGLVPDAKEAIDQASAYRHQPGSTIKPLVYACALEAGVLTPEGTLGDGSLLNDDQRDIGGTFVGNADGESWGLIDALAALVYSRNAPAAQLAEAMGPDRLAACLRDRFMIETDLDVATNGVRIALGLAPITLHELARAYLILANGGPAPAMTTVAAVKTASGEPFDLPAEPIAVETLSCTTTTWVSDAMQAIATNHALPPGVAAKTGTTASTSAVVALTGRYVIVAWAGNANPEHGLQPVKTQSPGVIAILGPLTANTLVPDSSLADALTC